MGAGGGLFRTKSVEQSIRDTDEPDSKLRKDLTARDLTVFGVAVVIGAGIFTLTAQTAGNMAGPAVSVAFVAEPDQSGEGCERGVDEDGDGDQDCSYGLDSLQHGSRVLELSLRGN